MTRYNKPEIAIIALLAFLFLARYSYEQPVGYTHAQVASFDRLVVRSDGQRTNAEKIRYLYDN